MTKAATQQEDYSLQPKAPRGTIAAPRLPYRPRDPRHYHPAIGLIGCGGITQTHLKAYRNAGYNVVALCDCLPAQATARRDEFYPQAEVYADYRQLLARDDIEVVDIATHPPERVPLIREALKAGKHVLSQKPFVLDLETGEKLVALADKQGRKLAVNQNGRWAPHFSYLHQAVRQGCIGDLISVHCGVHWDHNWVVDTPFNNIRDLVLYDFAIHWFDFVSHLLGDRRVTRVQASKGHAAGQRATPPLLAQALMEFEDGQGSLVFDAALPHGPRDHTYIGGTAGSLTSTGPSLGEQKVTLYTETGEASPRLRGEWFPDGFHGTMGELLCAIEEDREPSNSAHENLNSLALCFAAIAAATDGEAKVPGTVRRLPRGAVPARTTGRR